MENPSESGRVGTGIRGCTLGSRDAFGFGFGIGFFGGFGWGWGHWGYDWHHHGIHFDHHGYVSHSRVFVNRNHFNRAKADFMAGGFHGGAARGFGGGSMDLLRLMAQAGTHSGAFSGFNHGGVCERLLRLAGSRASAEASMGVEASTAAVVTAAAVTGNSVQLRQIETDDMEKEVMRTNNMKLEHCIYRETCLRVRIHPPSCCVFLLLVVVGFARSSFAQESQPQNVFLSGGSR